MLISLCCHARYNLGRSRSLLGLLPAFEAAWLASIALVRQFHEKRINMGGQPLFHSMTLFGLLPQIFSLQPPRRECICQSS